MMKARGAFSLIEVLIAIVVLALGLIGLAAIFPVVVTQQRETADAVQGQSAMRSIEMWITGNLRLSQRGMDETTRRAPLGTVPPNARGWELLSASQAFSPQGEWVLPTPVSSVPGGGGGAEIETGTGNMLVGPDATAGVLIPIGDRLWPRPYSTDKSQPVYVWDMAARRVLATNASGQVVPGSARRDDAIQVAVFVRRIDTGIRLPNARTLSDVLTGSNGAPRRVPVAADAQGRPTFDGIGGSSAPNYSMIQRFPYELSPDTSGGPGAVMLNVIVPATGPMLTMIAQIGQKFVDQGGELHSVIDVKRDASNAVTLQIEPGVSARVAQQHAGTLEMLYTPQVPAGVKVITVRP